jgi:hypothetical protein
VSRGEWGLSVDFSGLRSSLQGHAHIARLIGRPAVSIRSSTRWDVVRDANGQAPRHDLLIAQIVGLERRVSRAGRDSIDHTPGGHDDIANAVAGAAGAISGVGVFDFEFWHDDRAWNGGAPSSDHLLWFVRR